ncbi:MAG: triphosphoribosyl-dephospho-CoA synthase [Oribacterium sp.]|nr:triphosphoribosyl-dephospho-CoA synthase [Oribacterium sp.]
MQYSNEFKSKRKDELLETIGWHVRNALLSEVYATPKPGLVDRRDTGAHKDMNFETFLASTEAITPYLSDMFRQGFDQGMEVSEKNAGDDTTHSGKNDLSGYDLTLEEQVFLGIRKTGIEAEKAMYAATVNVNTHKGMIFTMGILLAAAGINAGRDFFTKFCDNTVSDKDIFSEKYKTFGEDKTGTAERLFDIPEILETGMRMSARILERDFEEMEKREPRSHGEKLYHKYGEKGIRGQAMAGFPIIRDIGIPAMRKFMNISEDMKLRSEIAETATLRTDLLEGEGSMRNEHYENAVNISTLMAIMSELRDTNVLTRSSYEEMEWLRAESDKIVKLGAAFSEEGLSAIEELNVKCIEKNISPGGAADILAVTILLLKLEGISYV